MWYQTEWFLTISTGLSVAIVFLIVGFSKRFLIWLSSYRIGSFRPLAPNWLTIWGMLMVLTGLSVYAYGTTACVIIGTGVVVAGAMLDFWDGRMARAVGTELNGEKNLWVELNHPGVTDLGKALDPGTDKIKIVVAGGYFVFAGWLSPWILGIMIIPEVLGTLMRRPFNWLSKKKPVRKEKKDDAANRIGKSKSFSQWLMVISLIPFDRSWIQEWLEPLVRNSKGAHDLLWIPLVLGIICIILATGSVGKRLYDTLILTADPR